MAKRSFRSTLSKLKLRWLKGWHKKTNSQALKRGLRVEALELRQLMAADSFNSQTNNNDDVTALFAEGEAANDLVAFAKALQSSGTTMYGAIWCKFCNEQKALFEDGADFVPFVEVTNADRTPNQIATDENITSYPTWVFPDGSRLTGVVSLATLAQKTGIAIPQSSTPSFQNIPNQTVLTGSPLHIPVDAYDPNGNPLTITVTSSNPNLISAEVLQGSRSVRMSIQDRGDMVFELFETEAALPTSRLVELIQAGFYNNVGTNKIIFHRVIDGFVVQTGDPTGTGTGGSTLGDFDDQYNLNLQHNRTGVLSFAKSSDDTNDSQFFITDGPQRSLDFNHSVFGQLVEGDKVREGISITSVNDDDKPLNEVIIKSMTVFNDTENGLIRLKTVGTQTGSATITVTVTDTEGNSVNQQFTATVAADTFNSTPFLTPLASTFNTKINTPLVIQLGSQDVEGDAVFYDAAKVGSTAYTVATDNTTGAVTITPPTGFVGSFDVLVGVRQSTTANTVDTYDTQTITVNVAPAAPTAVDLEPISDSGVSNSDNLTNAGSLAFTVSGTVTGATVELRLGTTLLGSATATGTTTTITTNNLAALGSGSYALTARQTVNNIVSESSPSLTINYDATEPVAIPSTVIPTTANVGTALSIDLGHAEEGQGLVYGLQNAPSGMTVNSSTGLLTWLPTATQLGAQSFSLTLTDTAGNTRLQNFTVTINDTAQVRFRLAAVSEAGAALSSLQIGQTFKLQVYTQDLRNDAQGVFSAYLDVLYNTDLIELVGASPVTFQTPYTNTPTYSTTLAGVVNEMGAFANSLSSLGPTERLFAEITMKAKASGSALFRSDAADDSSSSVGLYGLDAPVNTGRITYGTLTVPVALAFQVNNDTFNVNEDSTSNSLAVLANDTIQGSTVLTVNRLGSLSNGGTATISEDGKSVRYTPASNFNGSESFTYTVRDQNGAEATATVTVQVTAINDPPVANPDVVTITENTTNNVISVLSNDTTGPDANETLTVTSVGTPSQGGTVSVGSGGLNIIYAPKTGFKGTETVTYVLSDGKGGTATGTVTITVAAANPPPTAVNDTATIAEDAAAIIINAIANDSTSDSGETISISAVGTPNKGGTASLTSDGKVSYKPAANFNGTETITYTLRDSRGGTATGTITVTVTAVNDTPVAVDDAVQVLTGTVARSVTVLSNDTDVDGNTLTITAITQPTSGNGTVAISSDSRSLLYTPPTATFTGTVTFTYTVSDGNGATDVATVTLSVVNYTPRDIGGEALFYTSSASSTSLVSGFNVELTGVDQFGANVTKSTQVEPDGDYSFPDLAPGTYQISKEALTFLNDSAREISVASNLSDGDSMSNNIAVGTTLKPQIVDIRDFLGSARKRKLSVAVAAGSTQQWYHSQSGWNTVNNLTVQLNSAGTQLTIKGVNTSNQNVQAQVAVTDKRVEKRATENGTALFHLKAAAAELNFSVVTASSSASGEGEATAEGEGSDQTVSAVTSPVSSATVAASATSALEASNSSPATNSSISTPSTSTASILRSLTGRGRAAAAASPDPAAVDAAMLQLAPSLRLSSDLEQALTGEANDEEFGLATDQLLGN
jgi:large repetitive protein